MKFFLSFLILTTFFSCQKTQTKYSNPVEDLRAKKVAEFLDPTKSPLDGLYNLTKYFPENGSEIYMNIQLAK